MTLSIDDVVAYLNSDVAPDRTISHRRGRNTPQQTIRQRFLEFHVANPFVYVLLCRFARMVKSKGIRNYSMQALLEQVRWHVTFEDTNYAATDAFKLNNDFCAHYARMVMANEPDLDGMFATRVLKAA